MCGRLGSFCKSKHRAKDRNSLFLALSWRISGYFDDGKSGGSLSAGGHLSGLASREPPRICGFRLGVVHRFSANGIACLGGF